jgi:hypothetical protein
MAQITVADYEAAERDLAEAEGRRGLIVHAVVTVVVSLALIVINVLVASQFPWSPFPVLGMGIGLFMHWVGIRSLVPSLKARQLSIERRAAELKGA